MDGQEEMTKDPLFLAVTRPALWAGVPIEAGALIIMAGAILSTAARPPSRFMRWRGLSFGMT